MSELPVRLILTTPWAVAILHTAWIGSAGVLSSSRRVQHLTDVAIKICREAYWPGFTPPPDYGLRHISIPLGNAIAEIARDIASARGVRT